MRSAGLMMWCPYSGCPYRGFDHEVDDHRVAAHRDEPQAGSNQGHRERAS